MKIKTYILFTFISSFIGLSPPVLCKDKHVFRHIESLSRDYYYLNIEDPNTPFSTQDIVGGEHEKVYHVLGFPNETFIIVLKNISGEASYALRGEGFIINQRPKGDIVTIKDSHTWVSIGVSAHPFGEYKLTVKKHEF